MSRKDDIMNYVLLFVGLLVMCVPEDAGFLQFALQGAAGLALFLIGTINLINTPTTVR
jgi:hypothetical protein